jgi:hypothetical protein
MMGIIQGNAKRSLSTLRRIGPLFLDDDGQFAGPVTDQVAAYETLVKAATSAYRVKDVPDKDDMRGIFTTPRGMRGEFFVKISFCIYDFRDMVEDNKVYTSPITASNTIADVCRLGSSAPMADRSTNWTEVTVHEVVDVTTPQSNEMDRPATRIQL